MSRALECSDSSEITRGSSWWWVMDAGSSGGGRPSMVSVSRDRGGSPDDGRGPCRGYPGTIRPDVRNYPPAQPGPTRSEEPAPMTETASPASRAHQAAKRYIYAWGDGHAEGDATMRDLLGGKGAGLAGLTNPGLPGPP